MFKVREFSESKYTEDGSVLCCKQVSGVRDKPLEPRCPCTPEGTQTEQVGHHYQLLDNPLLLKRFSLCPNLQTHLIKTKTHRFTILEQLFVITVMSDVMFISQNPIWGFTSSI